MEVVAEVTGALRARAKRSPGYLASIPAFGRSERPVVAATVLMYLRGMAEAVSTRPLLDKLGVQPGARVAVLGVEDGSFLAKLGARTADITLGPPLPGTDLAFLRADSPADLRRLADLRARLQPAGAIWVVSRKGRGATLRDEEVIAAAIEQGLVDNKVVSFAETHTALRLVIPLRLRGVPR